MADIYNFSLEVPAKAYIVQLLALVPASLRSAFETDIGYIMGIPPYALVRRCELELSNSYPNIPGFYQNILEFSPMYPAELLLWGCFRCLACLLGLELP